MNKFKNKVLKTAIQKEGYDIVDLVSLPMPFTKYHLYYCKVCVDNFFIYTTTNPQGNKLGLDRLRNAIIYDIDKTIEDLHSCGGSSFKLSEFISNYLVSALDFKKGDFLCYERAILNLKASELSNKYDDVFSFLKEFSREDLEQIYYFLTES